MLYYSTRNKELKVSLKEAVLKGIAPGGGLFMPEYIPKLEEGTIKSFKKKTFREIAFEVSKPFCDEDIPNDELKQIIDKTLSFDAPLNQLKDDLYILELFHGPTLAFKDFGARFTANLISYFTKNEKKEINILVATSGDTGSAVANGFYNIDGIKVTILYPSNKVSAIQEKQLTTLGGNITALEIKGTFDDCQRLVKSAFADEDLKTTMNLSSANSINIARLLPQMFYYFRAYAQLKNDNPILFSVPSGNLGNLTAGLFANKMGLPVKKFISALNNNNVFEEYLSTGKYKPRSSVLTVANAMDVGAPSNIERIFSLFDNDHSQIKNIIYSKSKNDAEIMHTIKDVNEKLGVVIDPHTSVGYSVLTDYLNINSGEYNGIILSTAHPAKFADLVTEAISLKLDIPSALLDCMEKEKKSVVVSNKYEEFKSFLIENN